MSEKKDDDESDVDCTANRVASVTLESDSLSEAPKSMRSKRRRKIPRREKPQAKMDVDSSVDLTPTEDKSMEWDNSITDLSSDSCLSDHPDADDEQSDWPDFEPTDRSRATAAAGSSLPVTERRSIQPPPTSIEKRVERFLCDAEETELKLSNMYQTAAVKKLIHQWHGVQILKRGRGTIILRKKSSTST